MIAVSQDFKDAIKKKERKIKGYVEIVNTSMPYDFSASVTTTYPQTYTSASNIIDKQAVKLNYGALDNLPLDGSRLTMKDGVNNDAPFMMTNLGLKTIEVTFTDTTTDIITIVIGDTRAVYGMSGGVPYIYDVFKLTLKCYKNSTLLDTKEVTFTDGELHIDLDDEIEINKITLDFEWTDQASSQQNYCFLRLNQIFIGDLKLIKDNDLVEFTIDEEINKLVEETPINETNVTVNDMDGLFNPLNPTSLLPSLKENTLIIPFIGVTLANGTDEYVKMGEFYYDGYTNNKDKTTTLTGKTLMKDLEAELFTPNSVSMLNSVSTSSATLKNDLETYFKYKVNVIEYNDGEGSTAVQYAFFKDLNLINLLKQTAFMKNCILYFDRNDELNMTLIDNTIKDTYTKTELLDDVQFKNITKINKIVRKFETAQTEVTEEQKEIFSQKVKLESATQDFLFQSVEAIMDTYPYQLEFSQEGGTSYDVLAHTFYFIEVQLTGNVGAEVTFKIKSHTRTNNIIEETNIQTDDTVIKGETLEYRSQISRASIEGNKFDYIPSYEMEFDYNGDPSLEAGDYISVETPYGYKNLFIQKNHFKYDGGLEGHIEGVE